MKIADIRNPFILQLNTTEKWAYPLLMLISFGTYAAVFYKEINSDHAIHVLMAQDFSSYKDLYYWGQNRLGSLIPILAHPLTYFMHPLWAVSWVQYLLVLGVAFWLLYWVKNPLWRLALMLVWLFPSFNWACQILIAHSYSGQFFFLLTSLSLLHKPFFKPYLAVVSLWLAFWCSELSVAAVPAWLWLYYHGIKNLKEKPTLFKIIKQILFLLLIFSAGIILLLEVKHQLPDDKSYLSKTLVEDSTMLYENLTRALGHYIKTFGHDPKAPLINLLRWGSLIWPISFLGATLWALIGLRKQSWGLAHLWASVLWIIVGILLVSRYFHIMGSSNHYMSLMPTLSLFVLALYNEQHFNTYKKYLIYLLLPILVGLSLHHVYFFQFIKPYSDSSRINKETVKDFPLGNEPVGIVGNYWNSYIFGAFYPKQVAPTPYWGDYIRNWKLYDQAMDGSTVIVLGKGWMQPLADSIYMGKHYLIRNSEIEIHKDTEYAKYQSFRIENEN